MASTYMPWVSFMTCVFVYTSLFVTSSLDQLVPGIYMFGDSLVDVGNNNHLPFSLLKANFPHNGIDFPTGKPTGRFSNGKNNADFLAEKLGLPTGPPYLSLSRNLEQAPLTGVSFASGGAGILNETHELYNQTISLSQQVEYYSLVYDQLVQQLGLPGAQAHLEKSLFMIVIGSNDILTYFKKDSNVSKRYTPQQYVDLMASTLDPLLKSLHELGARKFVVTGVGNIGCCPVLRKQNAAYDCKADLNYWAAKYNDGLKILLKSFKSESSEINYSYFDFYGAMSELIQNPQIYGITEITEACCGLGNLKADIPCTPVSTYCPNRSNYLFWDRVHPTETVSKVFVDLLYDGSGQFTFPMNVEQLVGL
uniref:GDSL esterase/lipase At5g55050-like n=1 Tax=Erigeron canadensis TaxID=72917 RepID=UPI001CB92384|nr:GDSL esterase/lipase At5g55050-like [Erigeron canadensis]